MLDGRMRHKDNHGNEGLLVPGSVQWMTAGRGLVHSRDARAAGRPHARFPAVGEPAGKANKMDAPQYQEFAPERIPGRAARARACSVKVIAGSVGDVRGPIVQPATRSGLPRHRARAGDHVVSTRCPKATTRSPTCSKAMRSIGEGEDARALVTQELAVLGGGERVRGRAGGAGRAADPGRRPPAARTGRALRPVRDEHEGRNHAGVRGLPGRQVLTLTRRRHAMTARFRIAQ